MFHRTLIALAVALVALPAPATAAPVILTPEAAARTDSPAQPKIDQALAALQGGDLAAAEQAFKAAIALDARAGGGYLGMAEVAGRRGDDAGVDDWLRKGLAAAPKDLGLLQSAGRWHARKGRFVDAEKSLAAAAQLAPKSAPVLATLAELYLSTSGTIAKAEANFRSALAADAAYTPAKVGLARSLAGQGKTAEAREVLEAAARAAPTDPIPVHALARLVAAQGKFDDAIKVHQRTIAIAPGYAPAYLDQGDLYLARNDIEGAVASYRAGATATKDPVPFLFRMGVAFEAGQRWDEAERAYLDAVARDPKVYGAYNNLAFMSARRNVKLDQALEWARKAKELAPRDAGVADTLGWVHRARGELPQAATTLAEASRLGPRDPVIHHHLGIVYAELGRKADATAAFKQALSLSPNFKYASEAKQQLQKLGAR